MRYTIIFMCLMILLFSFSCKNQTSDMKEELVNQTNMSKAEGTQHPTLAPNGKESDNYIPGEILIKFKDGTDRQSIETIQKKLDLRTINVVPKLNIYRMKIENGSSVEEVMKRLQEFFEVEYSEPNYMVNFQ